MQHFPEIQLTFQESRVLGGLLKHTFSSMDKVEETLNWFIEYPHGPLVRRIPVGEGRRVETLAHLMSPAAPVAENDWRAAIEAQLAGLESEIFDR